MTAVTFSAGHGVDRSESLNPLDGEAPIAPAPLRGSAPPRESSSRRPAGHGVHRSDFRFPVGARCARPSSSAGASSSRRSRANDPRARAAHPYLNPLEDGVPAGHGVHRSISSTAAPSAPTGIRVHLRSSAAKAVSPAGHGVHRSKFAPPRRTARRFTQNTIGLNVEFRCWTPPPPRPPLPSRRACV
jgi:hypothetical protein